MRPFSGDSAISRTPNTVAATCFLWPRTAGRRAGMEVDQASIFTRSNFEFSRWRAMALRRTLPRLKEIREHPITIRKELK
jgi:hypothetical protein